MMWSNIKRSWGRNILSDNHDLYFMNASVYAVTFLGSYVLKWKNAATRRRGSSIRPSIASVRNLAWLFKVHKFFEWWNIATKITVSYLCSNDLVICLIVMKQNVTHTGTKTSFLSRNYHEFYVWKMWILWKMRFWKCELLKIEFLKLWFFFFFF